MAANNIPLSCEHQKRNNLRNDPHDDFAAPQVDDEAHNGGSSDVNPPNLGLDNESLAANLPSALSRISKLVAPNSARKRKHIPDLSRFTASPSHGTKMSMMFRDASVTLQELRSPTEKPRSNIKRSRMPFPTPRAGLDDNTVSISFDATPRTCIHRTSPLCKGPRSGESQPNSHADIDNYAPAPVANTDSRPETPGLSNKQACLLPRCLSTPITVAESPSQGKDEGKEPISSGFATPSTRYSQPPPTPDEVRYPEFGPWQRPKSLSTHSGFRSNSEYSMDHVIPVKALAVSPNTQSAHPAQIETWLDDVIVHRSTDTNQTLGTEQTNTVMSPLSMRQVRASPIAALNKSTMKRQKVETPKVGTPELGKHQSEWQTTLSNKENISPQKSSPSPTRAPIQHLSATPSRFQNCLPTGPNDVLHFAHPLTPRGHFNLPPRRKKACTGLNPKQSTQPSGKDFTIHDDQLVEALANLSPDVERYRKGSRPKRERCMSYWDQDVLPADSPCSVNDADVGRILRRKGKKVLGESIQSASLTKDKPFLEEAETAGFDFQA